MEGLRCRLSRRDGAFKPPASQGLQTPPKQFVACHMAGGLKELLLRLGKKTSTPDTQRCLGSHTNTDGRFKPNHPVPLLAGRYKYLQSIGEGQSSLLIAAEDLFHPSKKAVAIKIMHLNYTTLGVQEADCIQELNRADPLEASKTVRLLNKFMFDGHYCMVFELLRPRPLHRYFQNAQFDNKEQRIELIKDIAVQLLGVLGFLKRENVIHADLKPENILLQDGDKIKIKVVDFGNAIRWIHKEVSLYYDEFELQTLLYRAPEVIFGVPFGQEIDMWSLGCILAELYLGEPLFFGQTKAAVLQKMVTVLGPLPRVPFKSGKFYSEFSSFTNQTSGFDVCSLEARLMKKLNNIRNFTFANFLAGLLKYKPSQRFTPGQAAAHPFLASDLPLSYYCINQSREHNEATSPVYTGILLSPDDYQHRPHIDDDIKRQRFSGLELLRVGTQGAQTVDEKRTDPPPVGRVVPLVHSALGDQNSADVSSVSNTVRANKLNRHHRDVAGKVNNTDGRILTFGAVWSKTDPDDSSIVPAVVNRALAPRATVEPKNEFKIECDEGIKERTVMRPSTPASDRSSTVGLTTTFPRTPDVSTNKSSAPESDRYSIVGLTTKRPRTPDVSTKRSSAPESDRSSIVGLTTKRPRTPDVSTKKSSAPESDRSSTVGLTTKLPTTPDVSTKRSSYMIQDEATRHATHKPSMEMSSPLHKTSVTIRTTPEHPTQHPSEKITMNRLTSPEITTTHVLSPQYRPIKRTILTPERTDKEKSFVVEITTKKTSFSSDRTTKRSSVTPDRNAKRTSVPFPLERTTSRSSVTPDRSTKGALVTSDRTTKRASVTPDRTRKRELVTPERTTKRASVTPDRTRKRELVTPERTTKRASVTPDKTTTRTSVNLEGTTSRSSVAPDWSSKRASEKTANKSLFDKGKTSPRLQGAPRSIARSSDNSKAKKTSFSPDRITKTPSVASERSTKNSVTSDKSTKRNLVSSEDDYMLSTAGELRHGYSRIKTKKVHKRARHSREPDESRTDTSSSSDRDYLPKRGRMSLEEELSEDETMVSARTRVYSSSGKKRTHASHETRTNARTSTTTSSSNEELSRRNRQPLTNLHEPHSDDDVLLL